MTQLTDTEKIIAKKLVDLAERKTSIPYSYLSSQIKDEHGIDLNAHLELARPLGNIAKLCNELGLPLLSVRIEYKNDPRRTAKGFYDIACELKPEYKSMEPGEVRTKELQLTKDCKDWQRLLNYIDGINETQPKRKITFTEQLSRFVDEIITKHGIGHIVSAQEIKNEIMHRYGTNPNSILPFDYCYNRTSTNIPRKPPLFFEYVDRGTYKVLGKDYPYNGEVFVQPQGDIDEHVAGYCIDGTQYLGRPAVYPDDAPDDSKEYREGKKKTVVVNTYERNTAARSLCIEHYGASCVICGFNSGKVYGAEQSDMIHVHHLKMISETDKEYVIDPIKDLRPVCPNCHMILHSKKDCYSIDEVKGMLNQ